MVMLMFMSLFVLSCKIIITRQDKQGHKHQHVDTQHIFCLFSHIDIYHMPRASPPDMIYTYQDGSFEIHLTTTTDDKTAQTIRICNESNETHISIVSPIIIYPSPLQDWAIHTTTGNTIHFEYFIPNPTTCKNLTFSH